MSRLPYALKGDIAFKWAMTNNPHLLRSLLAAALGVAEDTIGPITITNPEMTPETVGSKHCLLDLSLRIGDDVCDLEVQVLSEFSDKSCYPRCEVIRAGFLKAA